MQVPELTSKGTLEPDELVSAAASEGFFVGYVLTGLDRSKSSQRLKDLATCIMILLRISGILVLCM